MGELGRGTAGTLTARQYSPHANHLTDAIRRSLIWLFSAVSALPPRVAPFEVNPPFGARSDAHGGGHVGRRVILDKVVTLHSHLPEWFVTMAVTAEGESAIYLFEICTAILTVCVVISLSLETTRSCVLFIDNQAALAALAKGSASSELGAVLVGAFWAVAARSPVQWWLEYVHTDSNDADAPSRDCNAGDDTWRNLSRGSLPLSFTSMFQLWVADVSGFSPTAN